MNVRFQESMNNYKHCNPINTSSAYGFFPSNLIWDLNYKHLHILFDSCAVLCRLGHWYLNFFSVESVKTYIFNSSKKERRRLGQNFVRNPGRRKRRKTNICSMKELENKAYPSEFIEATMFLDCAWLTGYLVLQWPPQLFFSFADKCLFPLLFFQKLFLSFSHEFNGLFLLRVLGGSEARVSLVGSLTQLSAALLRCDKLSKLQESKTWALFLHGFPCFKRINRVYKFDGLL